MVKEDSIPWVTFCISTYKRPSFLRDQLSSLLDQEHPHFEIVISDNDPAASAKEVVSNLDDKRLRYFHNSENLGMIQSFNRSMARATTEYIVMVTDDDPIDRSFLSTFKPLVQKNDGYSLYGGFIRPAVADQAMEIISATDFMIEILDPVKTTSILWSSCILNRSDALRVGGMPDNGSPHLADHALLAMTGSIKGGLILNKMFSRVTFHENNFSKFNFDYYVMGCKGFYDTLNKFTEGKNRKEETRAVVIMHLKKWFVSNIFNLKKYYTAKQNSHMLKQINTCSHEILALDFMKSARIEYYFKSYVFIIKRWLELLK